MACSGVRRRTLSKTDVSTTVVKMGLLTLSVEPRGVRASTQRGSPPRRGSRLLQTRMAYLSWQRMGIKSYVAVTEWRETPLLHGPRRSRGSRAPSRAGRPPTAGGTRAGDIRLTHSDTSNDVTIDWTTARARLDPLRSAPPSALPCSAVPCRRLSLPFPFPAPLVPLQVHPTAPSTAPLRLRPLPPARPQSALSRPNALPLPQRSALGRPRPLQEVDVGVFGVVAVGVVCGAAGSTFAGDNITSRRSCA